MTHSSTIGGVIFADNDPTMRSIVRSVMVDLGHRVFLARDGVEAVEIAREIKAMLVVLDLHMPNMDGLAACRAIRAVPGYAMTPITLLTADDRPAVDGKAATAGANRVIRKPFQISGLLRELAPFCDVPVTMANSATLSDLVLQIARSSSKR